MESSPKNGRWTQRYTAFVATLMSSSLYCIVLNTDVFLHKVSHDQKTENRSQLNEFEVQKCFYIREYVGNIVSSKQLTCAYQTETTSLSIYIRISPERISITENVLWHT